MKQELKNILFKVIISVFFFANQFLFSQVKNSTKQNVVIFLVDDLGSGEVACYGSKFHETPNIDALSVSWKLCCHNDSSLRINYYPHLNFSVQ